MTKTTLDDANGPSRPCTRCNGTQHFGETETPVATGTQTRSMWTCGTCGFAEGDVRISGAHSPGQDRVPNG